MLSVAENFKKEAVHAGHLQSLAGRQRPPGAERLAHPRGM